MAKILDRLFELSPYAGFDASAVPPDLQGWGSDHPTFEQVIEALRPQLIIEVGSWKGRSALHMAALMRRLGLNGEIVCVDTWLGSPEHWLRQEPGWYESLRITHGQPRLYDTFLANVVREGFADLVTPFPNTSDNAAVVLARLGVRCGLCYVDAAHEHDAVLRDLRAYWPLVADNGVLMGDDFGVWPGVTAAARVFADEVDAPLVGTVGKFAIGKGASRGLTFGMRRVF